MSDSIPAFRGIQVELNLETCRSLAQLYSKTQTSNVHFSIRFHSDFLLGETAVYAPRDELSCDKLKCTSTIGRNYATSYATKLRLFLATKALVVQS